MGADVTTGIAVGPAICHVSVNNHNAEMSPVNPPIKEHRTHICESDESIEKKPISENSHLHRIKESCDAGQVRNYEMAIHIVPFCLDAPIGVTYVSTQEIYATAGSFAFASNGTQVSKTHGTPSSADKPIKRANLEHSHSMPKPKCSSVASTTPSFNE